MPGTVKIIDSPPRRVVRVGFNAIEVTTGRERADKNFLAALKTAQKKRDKERKPKPPKPPKSPKDKDK